MKRRNMRKKSRKTSSRDTILNIYLNEINKVDLMSKEEEMYHAQRAVKGDAVSKEKLINANLRFVVHVAKNYQHMGLQLEDLINEGNIGLIKAIDKYDVKKGYRFISYAVWWIRQRILRALHEKSRMIRLPVNKICNIARIERVKEELENKDGIEAKIEEIAKQLNLDKECVNDLISISREMLSLDSPAFNDADSEIPLCDFIEDSMTQSPAESAIDSSLKDNIRIILDDLDPREADILKHRFGINGKKAGSLEEVGNRFNITKERVRQIVKRAIQKLKNDPRIEHLRNYLS
ncbi:MAG: RNA polymerase sigma factor RpoD/SigA [Spirochaetales bacterium]|nr:RNA polymerase sigma factor RpoD/SigA [Spirochaetales bacterium]